MMNESTIKGGAMGNEADRIWKDETVRALAMANDYLGLIDYCSGSSHGDYCRMWALAMTARFGGPGVHVSRVRADGTPDPEKCADCYDAVFSPMMGARVDIARTFGLADWGR